MEYPQTKTRGKDVKILDLSLVIQFPLLILKDTTPKRIAGWSFGVASGKMVKPCKANNEPTPLLPEMACTNPKLIDFWLCLPAVGVEIDQNPRGPHACPTQSSIAWWPDPNAPDHRDVDLFVGGHRLGSATVRLGAEQRGRFLHGNLGRTPGQVQMYQSNELMTNEDYRWSSTQCLLGLQQATGANIHGFQVGQAQSAVYSQCTGSGPINESLWIGPMDLYGTQLWKFIPLWN